MHGGKTMNLKSKKGYSLIEIGIGILILTVFLICSMALFNGCYNTYRMIQQRNLAINQAVTSMEALLQKDADILTGFFEEVYNDIDEKYELVANTLFYDFVDDNFDLNFKTRYAKLNGLNASEITSVSKEELEEYVYADKDYLINAYIKDELENPNTDFTSAEIQNGNYGFLASNVVETGNTALLAPGEGDESSQIGEMAIRTTVLRLPLTETRAYGNKVLKLKVEVLYINKINTSNLTEDDVKVITLESIKVAN